jgi:hypothetical protein
MIAQKQYDFTLGEKEIEEAFQAAWNSIKM